MCPVRDIHLSDQVGNHRETTRKHGKKKQGNNTGFLRYISNLILEILFFYLAFEIFTLIFFVISKSFCKGRRSKC